MYLRIRPNVTSFERIEPCGVIVFTAQPIRQAIKSSAFASTASLSGAWMNIGTPLLLVALYETNSHWPVSRSSVLSQLIIGSLLVQSLSSCEDTNLGLFHNSRLELSSCIVQISSRQAGGSIGFPSRGAA